MNIDPKVTKALIIAGIGYFYTQDITAAAVLGGASYLSNMLL